MQYEYGQHDSGYFTKTSTPHMSKSNSFRRHASVKSNSSLPLQNKSSRGHNNLKHTSMTPIFEQQKQQQQLNNRIASPPPLSNLKKSHLQRSHSSSVVTDDDMPLALLAYKKGYTHIYPSSDSIGSTQQTERINSYLSYSSSGSSSSIPYTKQQSNRDIHKSSSLPSTPAPRNNTSKRRKHRTILPPSTPPPLPQQQPRIAIRQEETITPVKEKKWYSSLRKLINKS